MAVDEIQARQSYEADRIDVCVTDGTKMCGNRPLHY